MAYLRSALRGDLRILAYHRVLETEAGAGFDFDPALVSASAVQFRAQMTLVKRRFHPVRLVDLLIAKDGGRPLPSNALVVTFDDGYDDNYRIAFPILRELGVPATFFVSTGHIDTGLPYAYDWLVYMVNRTTATRLTIPELALDIELPRDRASRLALATQLLDRIKSLGDAQQSAVIARLEREWSLPRSVGHPDCRPMTWDQLREMQAAGMEIGAHGVHHRMLAKLPRAEMVDEINASKAMLDRHLGTSVATMSYPVGGNDAFDHEVIAAARTAGFRLACSYMTGTSRLDPEHAFRLRRLPVESDMDLRWFAAMTAWPEMFSYPSRSRVG
jgi:peptidoglycan/xylan/chitin deacetylase (PgdA/CDA1 family)